jgi:hypothetical protein
VDTNNGRLRIAGVCEAVVAVLTGVHGRVNSTVVEKVSFAPPCSSFVLLVCYGLDESYWVFTFLPSKIEHRSVPC